MAVTISQFLLVFETLAVIRNIAQVFGRMSLDSDLSDVFLKIRLGLWIWGRTPGKKSPFSLHWIENPQQSTWGPDLLAFEEVCVRLLYHKITLFSPSFHTIFFFKS